AAYTLGSQYEMNPIATNVAMPGGIVKLMGLDFQICGPLTKENIRKILISSAQELLLNINSNTEIRPYLETYPFTIKNVEMNLFILDSSRIRLDHPHIGIAGIVDGGLDYLTLVSIENIPKKITESQETYEEAIKTLENEPNEGKHPVW
ncbi:MAG: hypothetical protein WAM28_03165, partial [Chlamydiales bacterium]